MTNRASRALLVAFAAFVVLGIVDAAAGPLWPSIRDEFGRSDADFGWIVGGLSIGYLIASPFSGHLSERRGVATTVIAGASISACAYLLLAISPGFWALPTGFVASGIGAGLLDPGINAWVATRYGPRQMGLLHGYFGVGAAFGPLVATAFIATIDAWRGAYVAMFVLELLVIGALVFSRRDLGGENPTSRRSEATTEAPAPANAARIRLCIVAWAALYVGVEVGYGSWAFTIMSESRGLSDVVAGVFSALFWVGLMVGRFVFAAIDDKVSPERTMATSNVLAIGSGLVFMTDPLGLGHIALITLGLAFASMFPIAVGSIPRHLGEDVAQRVVGYQFAAGGIGAICVPAGVGVIADQIDQQTATIALLVGVILAAATWVALDRTVRSGRA